MNFEHSVALEVGDWSGDGHGQSEVVHFGCTHSRQDVEKAYKKGSKALGVDWTSICEEYEDSIVPTNVARILNPILPKIDNKEDFLAPYDPEDEEEGYSLDDGAFDFATIYMWIAKHGNPEIEFEMNTFRTIKIGGYGLFY